jgi:hypothetical protein
MSTEPPARWSSAWYDLLAFALGLGLAWQFRWQTSDLVWSLWLASLTVGYAMILWTIFEPAWALTRAGEGGEATKLAIGGLFLVAFFTVHFGMFHFVHSMFLNAFFPIGPKVFGEGITSVYGEVVARYGWFVPVALLAERDAFRPTAVSPGVAGAAMLRQVAGKGGGMFRPYRNVVRLHLLIFFFAGASFLKVENFAVYAVVYAVYFFPWRLLRRAQPAG